MIMMFHQCYHFSAIDNEQREEIHSEGSNDKVVPSNQNTEHKMTPNQTCLTSSLSKTTFNQIQTLQNERRERVNDVCGQCRGQNTEKCRELFALPKRRSQYFSNLLVDDKNKVCKCLSEFRKMTGLGSITL